MILNNNFIWTFELPHFRENAGGIKRTIVLSQKFKDIGFKVNLRFQKKIQDVDYSKIDFKIPYSVGLPDSTFPKSDVVLTYADTPYGSQLCSLQQVKKVGILMLSFGMALERERFNIFNKKMSILSPTKRTQELIEKEKVFCQHIGFGTDYYNFFPEIGVEKEKIAVLLYHSEKNKMYDFAVQIVNKLCDEKLIDGVITFGTQTDYFKHKHPKKLIRHCFNAKRAEIREFFSRASIFIMPSITEGLNLTPLEATLCGCPSILCDGAIGDIFFNDFTCQIAEKNNFEDFYKKSKKILLDKNLGEYYRNNMLKEIKNFTWEKTIENILRVMS